MSILKALFYTILLLVIGVILSFGFQFVISLIDLNPDQLIHYNSLARILMKLLQYSIILFLVFKLWFKPLDLLKKIKKIKWETLLLILVVSIGFEIFTKLFLDIKLLINTNEPEIINRSDYRFKYLWSYDLIRAVILAPVLEELFFRKILFNRLLKNYSFEVSAIVSSVLFALIHIPNWLNLAPTFIFGIIACLIYVKTENILYPILLHFVGNMIVSLSSLYSQQISSLFQELNYNWIYWSLLILSIGMILFELRKIKKAYTV